MIIFSSVCKAESESEKIMNHNCKLFGWCFEPSQPQRITSGLNTNLNLSPSYSCHKSLYHKLLFFVFFSNHNSASIHNFGTQNQKNNNTCFRAYLYSMSTQQGNLHPAGWLILFYGPTQEPVLATANTGKTRERFWKNAGEWTRRVEICKEEIPGSKRSMYGYILTHSRL